MTQREAVPLPTEPVDAVDAMARAMRVLDRLLALAVERQVDRWGPQSVLDPLRGMHLGRDDVARLLAHEPLPPLATDAADLLAAAVLAVPRWQRAAHALSLDALDTALLFLAAVPELDLRYERIYGYLQDDLTRRRPSPDLLANLLATTVPERLMVLERLAGRSRITTQGLLEPAEASDAWLCRGLRIDPMWRRWLSGRPTLDEVTARHASLLDAGVLPLGAQRLGPLLAEPKPLQAVQGLMDRASRGACALQLVVQGPHGAGKLALAHAVADALGLRLLVADLGDAADVRAVGENLLRAARAAPLVGALLCVRGSQALAARDAQLLQALANGLASLEGPYLVLTSEAWPALHGAALPALKVTLDFPASARRRLAWAEALRQRGGEAEPDALAVVASRFALSAGQIAQAASDAIAQASIAGDAHRPPGEKPGDTDIEPTRQAGDDGRLFLAALAAAARAQSGGALMRMAQRVAPRAGFASLVCAAEVGAQLQEICSRVATREVVRLQSGNTPHAGSSGICVLFAGASGTGKTVAAEALAFELGLDLVRVDLAGIVSKYIGETEKNLDRVFAAATRANAVLFFDEADALFGKRSEVKDAHDRFANIEVAYLLQKMEQFDGLAILATNLKQNLDDAFTRRLTFTVNFPFPEAAERLRLWETVWPLHTPRAADVDLPWFAHEFRLSGGNIRNAVIAAAHLAAADRCAVTHAHLMHATRREFQKLGKNLAEPAQRPAGRTARTARA